MSALVHNVPLVKLPHPWRRLRAARHVTLTWHDTGPMGWCRHSTQQVSIRTDLTQVERRCTLAHELVHLERGPAIVGYGHHEERLVHDQAARWLISIDALADALVWCFDDQEVADTLWVDLNTVQTRLVNLTTDESAYINRRLDRAEIAFPKF